MERLFINLIDMSLKAGWLILAVIAFRLIFRRAPRRIFVILWGLVALRLIMPVSIESRLSLVPEIKMFSIGDSEKSLYQADGDMHSGHIVDEYFIIKTPNSEIKVDGSRLDDSLIPKEENTEIYGYTIMKIGEAPGTGNDSAILDRFGYLLNGLMDRFYRWAGVLSYVWIAGATLMLSYLILSAFRLRQRVVTAVRYRDNIFCSEFVTSPFLFGVFSPRIYLPADYQPVVSDSGENSDLKYVLAHERAHIMRGDQIWKLLGFLILSVYWFNPLVWIAYILLGRDIETACDEKVIANMESDERALYSTALLNASIGADKRRISACPIAFGETNVKSRIKNVMSYKKPAFWIIIAAVVVCVVLGVCFLTNRPADDDNAGVQITPFPDKDKASDPPRKNQTSELNIDYIDPHAVSFWGSIPETDEYGHKLKAGGELTFSDAMYEEVNKNWSKWNSMDAMSKALSSSSPGYCYRYFDNWVELNSYLGFELWNPLELHSWLEPRRNPFEDIPKNAMYTRYELTWMGNEGKDIVQAMADAAYTCESVRVSLQITAAARRDVPDGTVDFYTREDATNSYNYRWITDSVQFYRDGLKYRLRVWDAEDQANVDRIFFRLCSSLGVDISEDTPTVTPIDPVTSELIPGTDSDNNVDYYLNPAQEQIPGTDTDGSVDFFTGPTGADSIDIQWKDHQ